MATIYEKTGPLYSVGQSFETYDKDYKKWVNGIVEEVGDETILIKWDDLPEPTEYRIESVSYQGKVFYEDSRYQSKQ